MDNRPLSASSVLLVLALLVGAAGAAEPNEDKGGNDIPHSRANVRRVGSIDLTDERDGIGDVGALNGYAYLAAWQPECPNGGVNIVDIRNPRDPKKVAFASVGSNSYVGEGIKVIRVDTAAYTGDLLFASTEACSTRGRFRGGVSIWNVDDPSDPKPLVKGFGDFDQHEEQGANQSHSLFAWDAGDRAFVGLVDNEEERGLDIVEVTDPREPKLIAEAGLTDWPDAQKNLGLERLTFLHDLWVQEIDGHWYMLLAYWDAGFIVLNVDDPANPVLVGDTDWPKVDPIFGTTPVSGNAHQGTWTNDGGLILGTDEEFDQDRLVVRVTVGGEQTEHDALRVLWAPDLRETFGRRGFGGRIVFGGRGCADQHLPAPSSLPRRADQRAIVLQRGGCDYVEKVKEAQDAGYRSVVIANEKEAPRRDIFCGGPLPNFLPTATALCVGRGTLYSMYGNRAAKRELSRPTKARLLFDGWGYLNMYDASTLGWLDSYAIDEAKKRSLQHRSVHEIKVDPRPGVNLGYVSYYHGGLRVISFGREEGIREAGHFIAPGGSDFWGVFPVVREGKDPLILLSDRSRGLWILRYTGDS